MITTRQKLLPESFTEYLLYAGFVLDSLHVLLYFTFTNRQSPLLSSLYLFIFLGFHLFIFREGGREEEREGEKHQCVVASHAPSTGDLAHSTSTCPDWESNQQPFGSQACVQSSEPYQPGLLILIMRK